MFCSNCGSGLNPENKFCRNCGAAVQTEGMSATVDENVEQTVPVQTVPEQTDAVETDPEQTDVVQTEPVQTSDTSVQTESVQEGDISLQVEPIQQYQPYHRQYQQQQNATDVNQPYQPPQPPQPQQPYQPYPAPAQKTKRSLGTLEKILIPTISVAVIAGIALAVYLVMFISSPQAMAVRSLANVGREVETRADGTPLELFGLLMESLRDGTVTVDFEHNSRWEWEEVSQGTISLHSDERRGEYAFEADLFVGGMDVEFDLYLNKDVAAARVRQVDNNYYGIVFDTFEEDFRAVADLLELGREEIDEIVRFIDIFSESLRADGDISLYTEEYEELLKAFFERIDVENERVDMTSGDSNVRAEKVTFIVSARDIADVAEELFDVFADDESMHTLIGASSPALFGINQTMQDTMIREMRRELRNWSDKLDGEIYVSFFIGRGDRLLRIEVDSNLTYDGDGEDFSLFADFGGSADDLWVFEVNTNSGGERATYTIEWEMRESSRNSETVLRVTTNDRWSDNEVVELVLSWTDRGNFTLYGVEDRVSETFLSGVYTRNGDGFSLVIDDPFVDSYWDESLSLTISTQARAGRIEAVDFINISELGEDLIEKLEDLFGPSDFMYTPYLDLDPVPVPDPVEPPPLVEPDPNQNVDLDSLDEELIGGWEFSGGDATYFFWTSEFVFFTEDGFVMADEEFGVWSVSGNQLTVIDDFGDGRTYIFTYEIVGDILSITDSDNDTGRFENLW